MLLFLLDLVLLLLLVLMRRMMRKMGLMMMIRIRTLLLYGCVVYRQTDGQKVKSRSIN
jgi:hypothetical protein